MGDTFTGLGAVQSVFGSGSSPGAMGTGQQRFERQQIGQPKRDAQGNIIYSVPKDSQRAEAYYNGTDPGDIVYEQDPYKAWQDPQAEARRAQLNQQAAASATRQAPTTQAAQTNLAGLERVQGSTSGLAQGKAAQIGSAERVGPIDIGSANTYGGATIDPAAQARAATLSRQDAQFRSGQTSLMSDLQEQAAGRGPSLAEGQLKQATDRTLSQQAGLAASQGGSSALAKRQLATQASDANAQAARDAAQMRMQEQLSARQQLAGVVQTGREQDINVANAQAQLQQQASLANQQAINARAMQQAGLTQQAGLFSAGALNERQMQQAAMNAQLMQGNQQAANQFALQQAGFGQQMNLANMQAANQAYLQNAQLAQQANLANQQYYNQGMFANTGFSQQANLANQQAALQQQSLNDAMARYYTEAGLGLDARQQQAMMAFQTLQAQQALGYGGLEQRAYEGTREGIGGLMSGLGGMVGGMAMMSDEEVKDSVTRADDKIGSFLSSLTKQTYNQAESMSAPAAKSSGSDKSSLGLGVVSAAKAMSDKKAKDLSEENSNLRKQMAGNFMSQASGGKGFVGGLGQGISSGAMAKANEQKQQAQTSSYVPTMSDSVPNNPNMAISMPIGFGNVPPVNTPSSIVRDNPYGYAPPVQTILPMPPQPNSGQIIKQNPYEMSDMVTKQNVLPAGSPISSFLNSIEKSPISGSFGISDEKAKSQLSKPDMQIKSFLDKQKPYEYEYKDEYKDMPGAGHGRFVSPMAQDLQKSELGKTAVKPDADGNLTIDYGKLNGTMLASLAYLNNRLNELESKKGKK